MKNGKTEPPAAADPFNGRGPLNLSPRQLQQVHALDALVKYQRRVRVIVENLQREQKSKGDR